MVVNRRTFLATTASLAASAALPGFAFAQAGGTLRVGLSNPVIPPTRGWANMGIEGRPFFDNTIYDPLIYFGVHPWSDPNKLIPYLAASFVSDEKDRRVWVIELRQGVKFHDGSAFDADSFVWNLGRYLDEKSPQFSAPDSAGLLGWGSPRIVSWEKRGPFTVSIATAEPESLLPYSFGAMTIASRVRFEQVGSWDAFALKPSGTGPFKLDSVDFKQGAVLSRNPDYWDTNRIPRIEKMALTPIFEPNTRTTALVSGQVDWIEAVAPDTVDLIKARGFHLVTNPYPQVWGYFVNCREGSPYADIRVRKALSLAIDRNGMVKVLNGLMQPADGFYPVDHPWHGSPTFKPAYDPRQALALLREAGYGPDKRIKTRVLAMTGGSGMMQPPIMNAFVQGTLKEVGIDIEIVAADQAGMGAATANGAGAPAGQGCDLFNYSYATHDPTVLPKSMSSKFFPPHGINWGFVRSEKVDAIVDKLFAAFSPEEQDRLSAEFNAAVADEQLAICVAHDAFPRAFDPRVSGFVQGYNGIRVQDPSFITLASP
jgi:ABC-type transport system substrate-binding protein